MARRQCLDSKALAPIPSFVRCWTCGSWRCKKDVSWYPGRIIHPTLSEELVKLSHASNFDKGSIVRSHPPTPGSCRSCVRAGYAYDWQSCNGLYTVLCSSSAGAFSKISLGVCGVYCGECIAYGRECACGDVWLSDTCFVAYPTQLLPSPRCGARYCINEHGCESCHFCLGFLRPSVCFGCQAREKEDVEEEDTFGEGSQSMDGFERCQHCRLYVCEECCSTGVEGVTQCPSCKRWTCGMWRAFGEKCTCPKGT